MNKSQAITKLKKVLGASFAYREDAKAPNAEQREVIRAAWKEAKEKADAAKAAQTARYEELLAGDASYQELKRLAREAEEAADRAAVGLYRHRVTVGTATSLFFNVKADGDNWSEVVAKVIQLKAKEAA